MGADRGGTRAGIAKSTAHALLAELTSVGLTERLPCGHYRLGWRTLGLARTKLATGGYREAIMPTARQMASHFGETVHITAWERGRVLYVATERTQPRCGRSATSSRTPASRSATTCFEALDRGGTVLIWQLLVDDDKTGPAPAALMSLNMLVDAGPGRNYTAAEYSDWLTDVGFVDPQSSPSKHPAPTAW